MTTESLAQSPTAGPAADAAVPTDARDAADAEAVRVDLAKAFERDVTGIPPLLFVLPNGFHELPLRSDPAERAAAAEAFARELYPNGDEELWRTNGPAFAAMGEMTAATGVAYAAMGVFDNERGGVATVNLTIAATASDHSDPEAAALGLRELLVRDEFNDSRWLNLPCGPAVSRITVTKFPLDPALTAGGAPAELVQGQIQVFVPFPTGPFMAIVTLGTFNMESWVEASEMAAVLVQTITFPRRREEYEV
ncbi:hypothetical protein KGQ20_32635 [Catenulispora sp. NF23]|uniref:Suppressor of fused-like domain-containing protein n=1 Tax=Catenulispora pinistramenti TaxID=2705254 RepID=A0ABS5L340_9ACTN|nr:hypothetical protein [Catenulispora pinistramenti]MBS2537510.1 hypothetical protein [Catenulispora pinistramenti]MBS2552756.1 hypothetical protein [Catenulispora pinistramenti]